MIAHFLKFIFGTANQRRIKQLYPLVDKINSFENALTELSNSDLALKTNYFREKIAQGSSLEEILPEAFAVVREASRRQLGQRHYDVQLMGGVVLSQGKIAEMRTGEGKTLTATLALYLNALTGKGVHLVTANDYLAKRDAEWMAPIYNSLGMSISFLQNDMYDADKKKAYKSDILHGTSSEFGFDYLRDNMKFSLNDYVQRDLFYALVDEVDSVLIDEARTPLIISGQSENENGELILAANRIVNQMKSIQEREVKNFKATHLGGLDPIAARTKVNAYIAQNLYYLIDEKDKHADLTEKGIDLVEETLSIGNIYAVEHIQELHAVRQSLRAHLLFHRDIDYLVYQDEVLIIDENTGRVLSGRRYSDGLHQALEAKENLELQPETKTLASITIQNYFKLYKKLAGMTGTALTEAEEFHKIYNLDVVSMPTNKTMIRKDMPDYIFLTEAAKFKKIVEDIKERHAQGQPILIGTVAVETSEKLSHELQSQGIPHSLLNAKQHEKEAEIVLSGGGKGKITIATNMAGRGTDIKLSDDARDAGGLFILGTERHESRRIDNQLRGRSGRQGDPGETRFYISLEDTLIRRFGRDAIQKAMIWSGMKEDDIIEDDMISGQIEIAQEKIEKENFESRRHLIEYDSVLNHQRIIIYGIRKEIIGGGQSLQETIKSFFVKAVEYLIEDWAELHSDKKIASEEGAAALFEELKEKKIVSHKSDHEGLYPFCLSAIKEKEAARLIGHYLYESYKEQEAASLIKIEEEKEREKKKYFYDEMTKWFILETLDHAWRQHIVNLDHIRDGISLRSWGQKAPIVEYKNEAFYLFRSMTRNLVFEIVSRLGHLEEFNIDELIKRREEERDEIEQSVIESQTKDSDSSLGQPSQGKKKKTKRVGGK